MKITIIVEGKTEKAFAPFLHDFLRRRLGQNMPSLDFFPCNGRLPKGEKLGRVVETLLSGTSPSDEVVALTDVYTGSQDFRDAADAKKKMREWAGDTIHFHPHAAQYDFEAWLLPFWSDIAHLAKHNKGAPGGEPESVNHNKPPSKHIAEIFAAGRCPRHYVKTRDAAKILQGKDLMVSIRVCSELRAFVNTIITISGGTLIE